MENRSEKYKAIDRPLLEFVSIIKMRRMMELMAVEMKRNGPGQNMFRR